MGWHKPAPAFDAMGKIKRSIASFRVKLHGYKPFPSYRGEVRDKSTVLRRSKFAYCYENTIGPDNYITEKIFDSFLSGCVPVYWGAANVLEHIPADCFVDRRKFNDTAEVHQHLLAISPDEHEEYQRKIAAFLASESAQKFNTAEYATLVANTVLEELRNAK
jgi:hypothetical protein